MSKKISELPAAGSVATTDYIPIVDASGPTTKKVLVSTFLAGQFLTLATATELANERVFTPSTGLKATDSGAGGTYTMIVHDGTFAALTGSNFSGATSFASPSTTPTAQGTDVFAFFSGSKAIPAGTTGVVNSTRKVALFGGDTIFSGSLRLSDQATNAQPSAKPVGGGDLFSSASALKWADANGNISQLTSVSKTVNANAAFTNGNTLLPTALTCSVAAGETWNFDFCLLGSIGNSAGLKYQILAPTGSWLSGELTTNTVNSSIATMTTTAGSASLVMANAAAGGPNYTTPALHPGLSANFEATFINVTVAVGQTAGNVILAMGPVTSGQTATLITGSYMLGNRADRV